VVATISAASPDGKPGRPKLMHNKPLAPSIMNAPTTNAPRQYATLRSQGNLNFPRTAKISINVVPARKNRDPPKKSGGILDTAIFMPRYVLPQMTYTNAKHVMVMATGGDDFEFKFTADTNKIKRFEPAM
jgi:hypothetical protein